MVDRQDGYAPDLFSEHARAAQLGLRVVEILTRRDVYAPASLAERAIEQAALDLGFLCTPDRKDVR